MIYLCRVCVALSFAPVLAAATDQELTDRFRQALHDVDRIVLQEEPMAQSRVVFELAGTDLVKEFGALVEAEQRVLHCLCKTLPVINLYAGRDLRFTLTLHHSDRLRDENGPWFGDVKLTETSAERFRNWFSQKGYNGFVEAHAAMLQAQAEHRAHQAELQAQFPDGSLDLPDDGNYLSGKARDDQIARFRERVTEPSRRILACWRGLGSLQLWAQYRGHSAEFLLSDALKNESASDALQTLHALEDGDKLAWLGAFYHFVRGRTNQHGESANEPLVFGIRDESALLKLVQGKMAHDLRDGGRPAFTILEYYDTPLIRAWLVDLARGSLRQKEQADAPISRACWALLLLAQKDDQQVEGIAKERLRDPRLGELERLALQIVLARVDPSVVLTPEHLAVEPRAFAEMAWDRLKSAAAGWSLDALVAVHEKKRDWKIREQLAARGLRFLTEEERIEALWNVRYGERVYSLESTRQARQEFENTRSKQPWDRGQRALHAKLLYHEGRHLNRLGDYAAARSCLIQADRNEASEELAIACLGLGLPDQVYVRMPNDSPSAELLRFNGFVALARGNYEDAAIEFDTAVRLDVVEQSSALFAHLAYGLAKKPARSRLPEWTDPFRNYGVLVDEDGRAIPHWPESAILHLQGKLPWDELTKGVREMHGENRARAAYSLSVICRINGDPATERAFLDLAIETKAFADTGYLLAALRAKELDASSK